MESNVLPEITHASLRHRVTSVLRTAIIGGRLQPGDRIIEEDVSEQLKVSRGPVREALRQLEQEGLVVTHPYRGTEVLGVSQEEVDEILVPIRLTLERFAEDDVRFHELVISRSNQPHCQQIWKTIEPRVRAHFRRDAPAHPSPFELPDEHQQLLDALRTRDEATVLAVLEVHIWNYFKLNGQERGR